MGFWHIQLPKVPRVGQENRDERRCLNGNDTRPSGFVCMHTNPTPKQRRNVNMKTLISTMMAVLFAAGMAGSARADGPEMYGKKCASCHGKDGKAATAMGKKLNMKDLTDAGVQKAATDAQWEKSILEGVKNAEGKVVMPGTKISAAEAKDLVKVCRSFKK
jgi:mono/diheme cytochrome c family protein